MAKFFVNRPIVAMVISIIMTIAGVVAFLGLPVAQYPNIVPPEMQVNTTYVGADALTVEQSVATPIEQQMSGVDRMNYMYSTNANNGAMRLIVNFDVATDPNTDRCSPKCAVAGGIPTAFRRPQLRSYRGKIHVGAVDGDYPDFTRRAL